MLPEKNEIKLIELFKVCTKCKVPKILKSFSGEKHGRFGVKSTCKACSKLYNDQYRKVNLKQIVTRERKYYRDNAEQIKIDGKDYYEKHKEQIKIYRSSQKKQKKAYNKAYRQKNLKKMTECQKIYRETHKTEIRKSQRKYGKKRHQADPKYRLNCNIKRAICHSLKGNKNGRHWEALVGYTLKKLKKHLEKQFAEGMMWENYGKSGWVVDHKIPVSVFNFTKSEHRDFQRCWALKNLQPMWEKENLDKRAKLTKHFQPTLLL